MPRSWTYSCPPGITLNDDDVLDYYYATDVDAAADDDENKNDC